MDASGWDERYRASDLVWSAEPNVFVAEVTSSLEPGKALDLACGEGRNARWLASRGWKVTAVDFSSVAIEKARRLSEGHPGEVDWRCADIVTWSPPELAFDLAVLSYVQLPGTQMQDVCRHAADALAPGGHLLLVGHARMNLTEGVGGPQDPAVLYEPEDVCAWLPGLQVQRAEHVLRKVGEDVGTAIDTLVLATRSALGSEATP
ncbi:MAG: class I SAM-dependent methyltransferase [Actinomycetota bacterium]|jgi:SAM-dependent methyltransferase|nr:class I SAM-dependent methyltransferase [Actinomycetota bacterium]